VLACRLPGSAGCFLNRGFQKSHAGGHVSGLHSAGHEPLEGQAGVPQGHWGPRGRFHLSLYGWL